MNSLISLPIPAAYILSLKMKQSPLFPADFGLIQYLNCQDLSQRGDFTAFTGLAALPPLSFIATAGFTMVPGPSIQPPSQHITSVLNAGKDTVCNTIGECEFPAVLK